MEKQAEDLISCLRWFIKSSLDHSNNELNELHQLLVWERGYETGTKMMCELLLTYIKNIESDGIPYEENGELILS